MFEPISFVKIQIVIGEKVVMVLRADHLSLHFLLQIFIGVEEIGSVLLELIVVALIIEILGI